MPTQVNVTDVKVEELEIHSSLGKYDLTPHLIELNVYENIFRSSLTAELSLNDSHNIPFKLPIVGQETVDINIALTGFSEQESEDESHLSVNPPPLHVNAIKSRFFNKPKSQMFTLELVSQQYMSSLYAKVSRSYQETPISDIVSQIYYYYLHEGSKDFYAEPTHRAESVIIPNLNPIDAIKWLSKRSVPLNGNGINYLFFETMQGTFFQSVDSLANNTPQFTYMLKPRVDDPSGVSHLAAGVFRINKLMFLNQFDKTKAIKRGIHSSKLITHDIVKKQIMQHEYKGYNDFSSFSHFGIFPPLSNSEVEANSADINRATFAPSDPNNNYVTTNQKNLQDMVDSRVEFYPKHDNMYAKNAGDKYDNYVENWKLKRNNNYGICDGITLLLEVSGNSALRVGQAITVVVPSPETTDRDNMSDNVDDLFLTGTYMVTAIQHVFSRISKTDPKTTYTMKMEVMKDGLESICHSRIAREEN